MSFEDLEKMLDRLSCPECGARDLELKLRCDLGYERCATTVKCRSCHEEFEADQLLRTASVDAPAD